MRGAARGASFAVLAAWAAAGATPAAGGTPTPLGRASGAAIAASADCAACHITPEVAAPARTSNCTTCHQWVKAVAASPPARAAAMQVFPNWLRYEASVRTYAAVPDLHASFARLDPTWLRSWLEDPHDLRPAMPETMVRLGLDDAELEALAEWAGTLQVAVPTTPAPEAARVARGAELFSQRACASCHTFGALSSGPGIASAPDLRWARERMSDDMIAAWILSPQSVSSAATMPALGLSESEALALRDYVVLADPGGVPAVGAAEVGEPWPAAPRWDDVESRIFGRICVHCHMDPAQNEGRAGPGNAGGFGWEATGIELQTYEGVVARGAEVVAAMERRHMEERRDQVRPGEIPAVLKRPDLPGMPLGLPAMPKADIEAVKRWLAAGAPR